MSNNKKPKGKPNLTVDIPKPTTKRTKYVNERSELLKKLYFILGITDTNRIFYLDDLEKNVEKQNQILALIPDVKQYFTYGTWAYFSKPDTQSKPYLSLAKSVIKDMGIKTLSITERKGNSNLRYGMKIL